MLRKLLRSTLCAHLIAVQTCAAAQPVQNADAASAQPAAAVAPDWAKPAGTPSVPTKKVIEQAVRETLAAEAAAEPPRRHEHDTLRGNRYNRFEEQFSNAAVPGCLRPDGLKRQSTFGLGGILGLPFLLVAFARGKCN